MSNPQELFNLSKEESELTAELSAVISDEIKANKGLIPFSRYMELALYTPRLGYYSNPSFKFGAKGDFITAPLVSNLFGYTLALQLQELISLGVKPQVLEFGAGNGKLAADILSSVGEALDCYYILELSADLIDVQYQMLRQKVPEYLAKVKWLTHLPEAFEGIMLANEVLDAQPCDLVRFANENICGVGVALHEDRFCFKNYTLDQTRLAQVKELNLDYSDYQTEIHLASGGFIRSIATSLKRGAVLLIDYGYGEKEYYHPERSTGTLRGFYRQHLLEDVLCYPGLIDITSSVNWSMVATTAISAGLELIGYTSQANFLINCGIIDYLNNLLNSIGDAKYLQLSNQVNRLLSVNEMGDVFKVMGFIKGHEIDSWCGFKAGDRSFSL